jgi:hypothetical protein
MEGSWDWRCVVWRKNEYLACMRPWIPSLAPRIKPENFSDGTGNGT